MARNVPQDLRRPSFPTWRLRLLLPEIVSRVATLPVSALNKQPIGIEPESTKFECFDRADDAEVGVVVVVRRHRQPTLRKLNFFYYTVPFAAICLHRYLTPHLNAAAF